MPFLQTPSLNVHYRSAGTGESVLVLVHGNFASWRWWQPLMERLPAGYRAYAPDLRGYGDTERRRGRYTIPILVHDLHEFTAALRLPAFHLVGHSLGGAVALQFALDHPTCLHTLTLVAPAPAEGLALFREQGVPAPWLHRFLALQRDASFHTLDVVYRLMRTLRADRPLLRNALQQMMPSLPAGDLLETLAEDAGRMAPGAVAGYLRGLDRWNVQERLGEVSVPALILWGARDWIIPQAALERTAAALRQAELVVWPDVGHAPQVEQPERFARLLGQWIERHTPAQIPRMKRITRIILAFRTSLTGLSHGKIVALIPRARCHDDH
ncbi:MAG: alpha/beta hydrolase, partial [Anaerolineae bacterium]|nr:alpha/beta hydrolase [Anaerolineae bacterium]